MTASCHSLLIDRPSTTHSKPTIKITPNTERAPQPFRLAHTESLHLLHQHRHCIYTLTLFTKAPRKNQRLLQRERMSRWWWSTSTALLRSAIFRWPDSVATYVLGGGGSSSNWDHQWLLRGWETLSASIVDDVVWTLITAFESVALVSMLCFFFLFCGCTV